ncbi:glycosyl hydrolase 108 family protein [Campylobacter sp.]|uniref:glycosyl hydrolase 108 family protein n=1 Tax=Campylobacter sp. TaxID=205 RepID=UPI00258C77BA|nr:glycosyl hydrolase 108 family protein [Campylobacter sp.]MCI6641973.1 peptidoglycan domain protein [Campylobacter sp.]
MANFDKSFDGLLKLEFNSPKNALHQNKGESGLTYMGIYESVNPNFVGWTKIKSALKMCGQIEKASEILYKDETLRRDVKEFYKANFWDNANLGAIKNDRIADLIFKFGVNTHPKTAIKKAQKTVGVKEDGIIGKITLKAFSEISKKDFETKYKKEFEIFYMDLVRKNPNKYEKFSAGWQNRVKLSQADLDFIHLA